MSLKTVFESVFGKAFEIHMHNTGFEYVITMGASMHAALCDAEKLIEMKNIKKFEPFSFLDNEADYLIYSEKFAFKRDYIKKSVEILNPNEYAIIYEYNTEDEEEQPILVLRNNKYAILITTRTGREDEEDVWKFENFQKCLKKVPKSVFSL